MKRIVKTIVSLFDGLKGTYKKDYEYTPDKEILERLEYLYKIATKLLSKRSKGALQKELYSTKTIENLKDFVINYEKEYGGNNEKNK
jgi:DNA-dependent RNA polymerase auxiliary subunit epsilon